MDTNGSASPADLTASLRQFSGTAQYFRNFTGLLYTEGIQYLAEQAGAYWLIDLVGSYQPALREAPFQVWELTVDLENKTAIITAREDTDEPALVEQAIPYTDFPLPSFAFYCVDGVMLLKNEY